MDACEFSGSPELNQDIGGAGVRISFYLQTLLLASLSARGGSFADITSSFYTLLVTGQAIAVTALILGLQPQPDISLQDGIIVFYLLFLSWVTLSVCLPSMNRFNDPTEKPSDNSYFQFQVVKIVYLLHSLTIFAYAFTLLSVAPRFGSKPACNTNACVVLFRPFRALGAGRILGWIVVPAVTVALIVLTVKDFFPSTKDFIKRLVNKVKVKRPMIDKSAQPILPNTDATPGGLDDILPSQPQMPTSAAFPIAMESFPLFAGGADSSQQKGPRPSPAYELNIDFYLVIHLLVITFCWSLTVMNTELLIRWNHFQGDENSSWQFGQILPMFLVLLPFLNTLNAYREYGFRYKYLGRRRKPRPN